MSSLSLKIKSGVSQTQLNIDALAASGDKVGQLQKLDNLVQSLKAGAAGAELEWNLSPVKASGTLTCASVVEDNTCAVGGQTFTAKDAPSGDNQFAVLGSNTLTAAALAAKISAHPSLSPYVVATSNLGVVTITAVEEGVTANLITLTNGTNITRSGATLAGGTLGTVREFAFNVGDLD